MRVSASMGGRRRIGAGKLVVVRTIVTAAIKRPRNKGHKTNDGRSGMGDVVLFCPTCESNLGVGVGCWPYIMAHIAPPPRTSRRPAATFRCPA